MIKRPVCLIIRDGWGKGENTDANCILKANTPHTDKYENDYPSTYIETSGVSAGLPEGYQGNSDCASAYIVHSGKVAQSGPKPINTPPLFFANVLPFAQAMQRCLAPKNSPRSQEPFGTHL